MGIATTHIQFVSDVDSDDKNIILDVITPGTTTISNRRASLSALPNSGTTIGWECGAFRCASMTTSPQVYDSASIASSSLGQNGETLTLGVDGEASLLPNLIITYDEQ